MATNLKFVEVEHTGVTAPQDANKSSVLYVGNIFVSRLWKTKFLATRPEVEGFRGQGFVLQIYLK